MGGLIGMSCCVPQLLFFLLTPLRLRLSKGEPRIFPFFRSSFCAFRLPAGRPFLYLVEVATPVSYPAGAPRVG